MADLHGQTFLPGCAPRGSSHLEYVPPPARAELEADGEERRRVTGRVQLAVLEFARLRLRNGAPDFHMGDLTAYVRDRVPTAPDSAGRILRALHRSGVLAYELLSRPRSLYRVLAVDASREVSA